MHRSIDRGFETSPETVKEANIRQSCQDGTYRVNSLWGHVILKCWFCQVMTKSQFINAKSNFLSDLFRTTTFYPLKLWHKSCADFIHSPDVSGANKMALKVALKHHRRSEAKFARGAAAVSRIWDGQKGEIYFTIPPKCLQKMFPHKKGDKIFANKLSNTLDILFCNKIGLGRLIKVTFVRILWTR